jgi:hypothetical protein
MSLKSLIPSWLFRHDPQPEEVPMNDTVQAVEQSPIEAAQETAVAQAPAIAQVDKIDTFAEKLRHLLNLAEVETEHVWEEAVALAKKLV